MVRSMLAAGLLLAAMLFVPGVSAGHDDPSCPPSAIENPNVSHYICAVTGGLGGALDPFLEALVCIGEGDPVTLNVAYIVGCF